MAFVCKHPPLPKTGTHPTWVTETAPKGLPPFTECVARAIYWSGGGKGDISAAVRDALGRVEDWAQGMHGAKPETVAKAKADVAILKAKLAQTKGKRAASLSQAYHDGVIDLATFDETKHRRVPKGSPGGGRFATLVADISKLKQGEARTVHAPSATRVKRITATRFQVESQGKAVLTASPHEAASKAVRLAKAAQPVKRVDRRAMHLTRRGRRIDLATTVTSSRSSQPVTSNALVRSGKALPPRQPGARPRFPIRNHGDVKKAIRAVGRAKPATPEQRAKVRRHILKQAKKVGAAHLIPATWAADGSLKGSS